MMDSKIWLIVMTDSIYEVIGKRFLGLHTELAGAKQLAQTSADLYLKEHHIAEIDGIWCIEGREEGSDQMSFIGVYDLVKRD
jgi:hypothetical protein